MNKKVDGHAEGNNLDKAMEPINPPTKLMSDKSNKSRRGMPKSLRYAPTLARAATHNAVSSHAKLNIQCHCEWSAAE